MRICRIISYSGDRKSRRLMSRILKRVYHQLMSLVFLLGCCLYGLIPAYAFGIHELKDYKDHLWITLYVCIGCFVAIAIWDIAMMRYVKRAEQEELENVQKSIAKAEKSDNVNGLISDSADPFQALLNQAGSSAAPKQTNSNIDDASPKIPYGTVPEKQNQAVFNGASTLPMSVALVGGTASADPLAKAGVDDSNNPFKRPLKPMLEEKKPSVSIPKLEVPLSKPGNTAVPTRSLPSALPTQALNASAASNALNAVTSGQPAADPAARVGNGAAPNPSSGAASNKPSPGLISPTADKPLPGMSVPFNAPRTTAGTANPPSSFSGNSTVAVKAGGAIAASNAVSASIKPGMPVGGHSAPASKPFGFANAPKPGTGTPLPGTSSASKPMSAAGKGEDPWKKLLGQTGGRMGTSASSSSAIKPGPAVSTVGTAPMPGASLKPASGFNSSFNSGRAAASGKADDPWKALLGANKGTGSKPGGTSAQPSSLSLDIKKFDHNSAVKES